MQNHNYDHSYAEETYDYDEERENRSRGESSREREHNRNEGDRERDILRTKSRDDNLRGNDLTKIMVIGGGIFSLLDPETIQEREIIIEMIRS